MSMGFSRDSNIIQEEGMGRKHYARGTLIQMTKAYPRDLLAPLHPAITLH